MTYCWGVPFDLKKLLIYELLIKARFKFTFTTAFTLFSLGSFTPISSTDMSVGSITKSYGGSKCRSKSASVFEGETKDFI